MNILLPHNIFSTLIAQSLDDDLHQLVQYKGSALLAGMLDSEKADIVLLPSLDILKHQNYFISSRRGISFDGGISNSYLYFAKGENSFNNITLAGDISGVEAILSKIVINELYDQSITVSISPSPVIDGKKNIMLAGDINFENDNYLQGLNFADEIIEITGHPFVNFVFASKDKEKLLEFEARTEGIEEKIYKRVTEPNWDFRLSPPAIEFFRDSIQHVIYEFDESDHSGLEQIVQLCYFHGILKQLFDIKFT